MVITDLKDNCQIQFVVNRWLAVDQEDGQISIIIPAATEQELQAFEYVFLEKTSRDLTDNHLWFSVLSKPTRSNFTVVQRVWCCLAILLSTMLANAMFYERAETAPRGDEIDFGGFTISWTQVVIGIQSSVVVFIPNLFVTFLFRKSRPSQFSKKRCGSRNSVEYSMLRSDIPSESVDVKDIYIETSKTGLEGEELISRLYHL